MELDTAEGMDLEDMVRDTAQEEALEEDLQVRTVIIIPTVPEDDGLCQNMKV